MSAELHDRETLMVAGSMSSKLRRRIMKVLPTVAVQARRCQLPCKCSICQRQSLCMRKPLLVAGGLSSKLQGWALCVGRCRCMPATGSGNGGEFFALCKSQCMGLYSSLV